MGCRVEGTWGLWEHVWGTWWSHARHSWGVWGSCGGHVVVT